MNRVSVLVASFLVVILVFATVNLAVIGPGAFRPRPTPDKASRVRIMMTRAKVWRIFGCLPGDYRVAQKPPAPCPFTAGANPGPAPDGRVYEESWTCDGMTIPLPTTGTGVCGRLWVSVSLNRYRLARSGSSSTREGPGGRVPFLVCEVSSRHRGLRCSSPATCS